MKINPNRQAIYVLGSGAKDYLIRRYINKEINPKLYQRSTDTPSLIIKLR